MFKFKIVSIIISLIVFSGCTIISPSTNEETTQNMQNYRYPQYGFAVTIPDELKEITNNELAELVHVNADTTGDNTFHSKLIIVVEDEIPTFPNADEDLPTGVGVSEISEYVNNNALTIYEVMISDEGWIAETAWTKVNDHYIHFSFYSHAFHYSKNLDVNQYKEEIINSIVLLEE